MDRQVEVVAGNHVVIRVAGAVILVAHKERGKPATDSRALVAARALADLATEAGEQAPGGPGRLVARQATRWLMKDAERISPGVPVEFGILSAADTGGLAIFLHGSITAVLSGAVTEYYRGSDAAFTVDRVADHPSRAAALFIEESKRRIPELPERGIGSLVEGVAAASGAVIWFEGEPLPVRTTPVFRTPPEPVAVAAGRRVSAGARADDPPPPTAAFDPEPDPGAVDPNLVPTRTSARLPTAQELAEALGARSGGSTAAATAGSTPIVADPSAATSGYNPRAEVDPHRAEVDRRADFDPHHAPTEVGGPGKSGDSSGTNPAPKPDPDLQRRLEATAKANALTVKVLGFKCARAHPSDPRSAFCSVCGMPVDQTQPVSEVVRPPLGMLVLDDGMTYVLATNAVLGRDPEFSEAARNGLVPLKIDDTSGGMSRAHAEIVLINWDVTVVDRGSTNGTRVRVPGYRDWVRLQPNQPMTLIAGSEVMLGNRMLRLEPVAPPPFG
ncbi:FHA domain-containing protein [Nocardia jejuensis]|uniref:FHA domain-containing protein n=1 Tax=Nocardia jejuensis TaxID=328049 RepID=UPI00083779CE|nr:FHA domain-containing protein [Nocardia jejuensis]